MTAKTKPPASAKPPKVSAIKRRRRDWTPEQKRQIIVEISEGIASGKSAAYLLDPKRPDKPDHWPCPFSFWMWIREPDMYAIYDEACKHRVEVLVDDVMATIEQNPKTYTSTGCSARVDPGWVAWRREVIDVKLRMAGVMRPRRWGKLVREEGSVSASDLRNAVADIDRATGAARDDD